MICGAVPRLEDNRSVNTRHWLVPYTSDYCHRYTMYNPILKPRSLRAAFSLKNDLRFGPTILHQSAGQLGLLLPCVFSPVSTRLLLCINLFGIHSFLHVQLLCVCSEHVRIKLFYVCGFLRVQPSGDQVFNFCVFSFLDYLYEFVRLKPFI